jgi:hypothetical protein
MKNTTEYHTASALSLHIISYTIAILESERD